MINTGNAYVRIMVNGTEVARKTMYSGVPNTQDYTASCGQESGGFYGSAPSFPNSVPAGIDQYEWATTSSGWTITLHPNYDEGLNVYMSRVRITWNDPYSSNTTTLQVRAHNSCGWGGWKNVGTLSSSSVYYTSAYPNPVSDILTVNFEPTLVAQTKASLQTTGNVLTAKKRAFTLDVKLYDYLGSLRHSATSTGETLLLNVSELPNGIYFLHVHDGIMNEPEVKRIIVSH
jgi:hypothetical protein